MIDYTILFLMNDQPMTCGKCGTRTDYYSFMHTNAKWEVHFCLYEKCAFAFLAVEE